MSKADEILKKIEAMNEKQFLPIVGPTRGQVLVNQIHNIRPKRIVEIGTLIGYSTILMAKELDNSAHITTIEISAEEANLARENIRKAEVRPRIDVIVGDAIKVLPELTGKFDMVFIDAAKGEYLDYLRLIEKKLHKGSIIVADNVRPHGKTKNYLEYIRSSDKYASEYFSFGEQGVEVSVKL